MNASNEAELSIHEFVQLLSRWKWSILIVVIISTSLATIAAYVLPKKYAAIVLISPVSDTTSNGLMNGLNSMVSQLGGLASLSGVASTGDTTKAETLAVLESEALTEQYIKSNNLLPVLYKSRWDAQHGRWNVADPKLVPTLWQANQLFKKSVRKVSKDAKSGLVTLTITWSDPTTAAKWANDLVKLTNDFRRDKAIAESENNIGYLTAEAAKTDVVGVKQAIYSILQKEISKMMLARGDEEYAIKVIDPATPPEKPTIPPPIIWVFGGLFAGLGMSMGVAFLYLALRKPST